MTTKPPVATGLHSMGPMEERRKSPRRTVHGETATIPTTVNVQLLDVSVAGVLLQSAEPVDVGTNGCLSVSLDGVPFKGDVRVQRVEAGAKGEAGGRLGARFVALSPEQGHVIKRFIAE